MPKSQVSPGKEVTVSSDGLVSSEEIVKGKGRVSSPRPNVTTPPRPISANFGEISNLSFSPNPVIRGGTGSATIGFAPGATIGLSAIQYKFSYRQIGSGASIRGRWTGVPLTSNTFNFYPNINAERGALEVRTVFNNTPIFTKSVSVPLTDQPVAPSFSSNPTINDVTAASGDTITVGSFTANGNPTPVVTYQWYLNSSAVSGATSNSYTTTAVGGVSAAVILTNSQGTVSATAEGQVGLVPTFTGTPSASATGVSAGTAVTINNVGATGTATIVTSYLWTQNSSVISGATLQSYTTSATGPLSGKVTITNNFGTNNATVSFGTITGSNFAPYFTGTPAGSTTNPDVGERMTFLSYGSTGLPEPSTSFQWYDDGVAISGATGYGYVLGATGGLVDATKTVIVTVSSGVFYFDGVSKPANYPLTRGVEYTFDLSDSTTGSHPFRLGTASEGSPYTNGYTTTGSQGSDGAKAVFIVPADAPATLYYYCNSHSGMGNSIAVTTVPATGVTMTGNLTGVVSLSNGVGTTGATIDFGTMLNADITNLSLGNVVAGATLTATVTYGGTYDSIVWTGVTS